MTAFIPSTNALPSDLKSFINSLLCSFINTNEIERISKIATNKRISWSIFKSFICSEISFWKFSSNFYVGLPAPILMFKYPLCRCIQHTKQHFINRKVKSIVKQISKAMVYDMGGVNIKWWGRGHGGLPHSTY